MNNLLDNSYEARFKRRMNKLRWRHWHIDPLLLTGLIILTVISLFILFSASNENFIKFERQIWRFLLGFLLMVIFAQIPPRRYKQWIPWTFLLTLLLLAAVLVIGKHAQGARRWLEIGFIRFQPSEVMKLALPMMLAWYLNDKPLPPKPRTLLMCGAMILIPVLLTAKEPDLGTAIIIGLAGLSVVLLSGISWKLIISIVSLAGLSTPVLWHFMHRYQKQRVLTFLNPERDPLGSGYHIIQSKIAIGSGGFFGKGWLNGTQSHLSFLPAHTTDFIFAVSAEEFGMLGCTVMLLLFIAIFMRCLYMSSKAQSSFTRLLSGGLCLTFILCALINMGMVMGILPVVGIPLPLISYGGSSMLISMISFGIIMSIYTHRKLYST